MVGRNIDGGNRNGVFSRYSRPGRVIVGRGKHPELAAGIHALSVTDMAAAEPRWQRRSWRNRRDGGRWTVQCVAQQ